MMHHNIPTTYCRMAVACFAVSIKYPSDDDPVDLKYVAGNGT
jgi:hypothetical protein